MSRLVVRLKDIKHKKDFICYLSSYPDLDFQAAYVKILFFKPHTFKILDKIYLPKL